MRAVLPRVFDVGLAVAVVGVGLAEVLVPFESRQGDGSIVMSSVSIVAVGLILTQRRRYPLAAGLAALAIWPVIAVIAPIYILFFGQFLPMAIAVYSMARYGAGRVPFVGAAAGAALLLGIDVFVEELQSPGEIFFHWAVFAVVWGFGFGLRVADRRARESLRRAIDAEVTAAEQAMAAVVAERTRIARELHDIVAHSVSTMVVQAGAAEQVVDDDPAYVRRALAAIRETGTSSLTEMRRVVAMLRTDDESDALAPQPGVADLPTLLEEARTGGLDANLHVLGDRRALAAGIDLAAYRIVQEALTNVRRHAAASAVTVRLVYGADNLRVEVSDDGAGAAEPREGHGLVGMRERAALYGGTLETASDGSGFMVRALLPTGGSA